jgi:HEAT repeat protein
MTASNGEYVHPARNDPRTVDELIAAALMAPDHEDDGFWDVIAALHWRGSKEVLIRGGQLCRSFCAVERRIGAAILGQLGVMERTFPKECVAVLLEMLRSEKNPEVLGSVLFALGHHRDPGIIRPVSRFRHHPDCSVRYAAAHALTRYDDPLALNSLVELTRDEDDLVRDWATFGLARQVEADTPLLRDALVERLTDPDDDTRAEALIGLALRGDRRLIPALQNELQSENVDSLAVESAAEIADAELYPALVALQNRWDVNPELLQEAIANCAPRVHRG